jgi:hypothetical protein
MTKRQAQVVILCEDRQQQTFIYRWLIGRGYTIRQIRLLPLPAGAGSGEQYVRSRYAAEVKALRARNYLNLALATAIDADHRTVDERHQELESELRSAALTPRNDQERIAVLVPKRNIETWIHYLFGTDVDEETIYPKLERERDCQSAVDHLLVLCQPAQSLSENCPASVSRGIVELLRLP